jgi:hypothetical protein
MPSGTNALLHHQIRLEIALESGIERINVAGIIRELMKRANSTPDVHVKFADIHGESVTAQTLPKGQEFATRMAVEKVETGRTKKVVLGMYMMSSSNMQNIKTAIGFPWLRQNQIYMRHQRMSFNHGTDLFLIGYLVKEHPTFANLEILESEINGKWFDPDPVLDNDPESEAYIHYTTKIAAMTEDGLIRGGKLEIPISVERSFVKVSTPGKNDFDAQILSVYVPRKHNVAATFLNDYLILDKGDLSIVPFSLSKSDPPQFYQQMKHHAKFLHEHRNIPILAVPTRDYYAETIELDSAPITLQYLLAGNPNIHRFHYIRAQKKINVSVHAADYAEVCKWLDHHLSKFSYAPHRLHARSANSAKPTNSSTSRVSNTTSKYANAFSTSSTDSSFDPSTIATGRTRTNAWNRGPPTELIFEPTDEIEFPPLAQPTTTVPPPTNQFTAARPSYYGHGYGGNQYQVPTGLPTTGNNSTRTEKTVEELIASAVAASEAQMNKQFADIAQRQRKLDKEIASLHADISSQASKIVEGTIKALSGSSSPFFTKADALELKQQQHDTQIHIRDIQQTLARFMQHFSLPDNRPPAAPNEAVEADVDSPPRKISRTPSTMQPHFPADPTSTLDDRMDWGGDD